MEKRLKKNICGLDDYAVLSESMIFLIARRTALEKHWICMLLLDQAPSEDPSNGQALKKCRSN